MKKLTRNWKIGIVVAAVVVVALLLYVGMGSDQAGQGNCWIIPWCAKVR